MMSNVIMFVMLWSIQTNDFFALMRALFGYTATPTFVEAAAYIMYWLLVIALFVYRHNKGTLVDKDLSKYEEEESNPNPTYELSLADPSIKENRESEDTCSDDSREVIEGKGGETLKAAL